MTPIERNELRERLLAMAERAPAKPNTMRGTARAEDWCGLHNQPRHGTECRECFDSLARHALANCAGSTLPTAEIVDALKLARAELRAHLDFPNLPLLDAERIRLVIGAADRALNEPPRESLPPLAYGDMVQQGVSPLPPDDYRERR
jgi:hypothetical protein